MNSLGDDPGEEYLMGVFSSIELAKQAAEADRQKNNEIDWDGNVSVRHSPAPDHRFKIDRYAVDLNTLLDPIAAKYPPVKAAAVVCDEPKPDVKTEVADHLANASANQGNKTRLDI